MSPSPPPARVAAYARVSTLDQHPEMQIEELRTFARGRGWQLTREFVDRASGKNATRPQLMALLEAVHRHEIDHVLVWKLDRLGRSVPDLCHLVETFRRSNVEFTSLRDPNFDTTTPGGKLIFHVFAAVAEFERGLISERVRAALSLARARGKRLGRPPALQVRPEEVRRLYDSGGSIRSIARELRVSPKTVWRALHAEPRGARR